MKTKVLIPLVISIITKLSFSQGIEKDTIKLEEVVVTGTRVEVSRKNVPMTVTTISKDEINQSEESALLPVISARVPGVFVTERGVTGFGVATGSAGGITIRGIGGSPNTQVLVLIDGHPQFMGIFGHPLPDAYVASDAEKIEIIRGPASILYGSNAMGGVINIITRKQKEDGLNAIAKLMYGSFNTQKYMANGGFKKNKFNIFTSVNHDRTDGHRDSSDFKITNGYLKAGYKLNSNFSLVADVNLSKFEAFDPGPESGNVGEQIDILRGKAAISLLTNFEFTEGAITYYHNFGEHNISDGFHSNDHFNGIMFYQGLRLLKNNVFTLGVDYKNFGGMAENVKAMDGEGIIFGDETITETGIYAFSQQTLFNNLVLNAGLRNEINSKYGNELVPQAGFVWHPFSLTTLKGSVSKGFRSPSIRELYLWAPANEELEAERMINYEIGIIQDLLKNKLRIELTSFISEGDNLIKVIMTENGPKNMNTGNFLHKGLEFMCQYRPIDNLYFNTNYSYLHMKEPMIASPEQQFFIEGNYRIKRLSFNMHIQHIHSLYTRLKNVQNSIPAEKQSYTLLNVKIVYKASELFNVFISGKNLTNQHYEINNDYPMPGITFFGGINFHLNKIN